jgi:hypothetical protein
VSARSGDHKLTSRFELSSPLFGEPDTILEGEPMLLLRLMAIKDQFKRVRKSRAS